MNIWPIAVECPDCKKTVCWIDLTEKRNILSFKFACDCGSIVSYSKKSAKLLALKQLPKGQKKL